MLSKENIGKEKVIFDTLLGGLGRLFFHIKTRKTLTACLSSPLGKQPPSLVQKAPVLALLQQAAFPPCPPAPQRTEQWEKPHHHPAFLLHLLLPREDCGQQAVALLGETGKRERRETLQPRNKTEFTYKD